MNTSLYLLLRATRGPIVLITMGVLFWLDQTDQLGFGRTWPVLIIAIGVMKLMERIVAPPVPPAPPMPPVSTVPPMPPGGAR